MSDFLLWVIPGAPLLAALIVTLAAPLGLRALSPWPVILALLASTGAAYTLLITAGHETIRSSAWKWIDAGGVDVTLTLRADSLTLTMLSFITFVSLLIAIYSIGYMAGSTGFSRYFAALSLFVASMTLLVEASDFVVLFLAWELVGLCSYLLIGYYQDRPSAGAAAKKAFIVNRVGDFGFLVGIFWLWTLVGKVAPSVEARLDFDTVFGLADRIAAVDPNGMMGACLSLFLGAVGKSAQFPLHTWLPDAMEGPSPVSALIHAATMVTAGVYFVARLTPLLVHTPDVQLTIAVIGGITALLAALIALTQNDLKRVLAYSTVSQLGYMFLALGCAGAEKSLASAAVTAAIFHVFTHAFFKALLFLSAGSVMHAMGDVIDMRRFGGLRKALPFTHIFFLSGAVALAGLPIFSGFWSKDAILDVVANATKVGTHKTLFGVLQLVGLATAFLTAFYTFRAYFMTFWGEERFPPEAGRHPHESPIVMAVPMAILTPLALFIGLILGPGIAAPATSATPGVTILKPHQFAHYLQSNMPGVHHVEHHVNYGVLLASVALSVFGILLAWQFYLRRPETPRQLAESAQPLYEASSNRFYVDEIYNASVVAPLERLAVLLPKFDRHWLDKIVDVLAAAPRLFGRGIRGVQDGFLQSYAFWMLVGVALLLVLMIGGSGS
jgi:NADH-quinone oxidoreductase subunit L